MLRQIGKYRIVEYIADGGQGTVYRAFDPVFNRTCAIKVMNHPVKEDPGYLSALHMKTRLSVNLHHPGIVTTYDCGRDTDSVFIVTDYLPGSLAKRMDSGKSLTNRQAVKTAHQIGRALDYAHQHGILHGNVKPENILYSGTGAVKVSDFGISKCMAFSKHRGHLPTRSSLFYSAPEQIKGVGVDQRSDIYSLGKLLKEMVMGTIPLSEEGIFANYTGQIGLPGFFADNEALMPRTILSVIGRATSQMPDDRYNSMSDMILDLQRVLRDLPEDLILKRQSELNARIRPKRPRRTLRKTHPNDPDQKGFNMPTN